MSDLSTELLADCLTLSKTYDGRQQLIGGGALCDLCREAALLLPAWHEEMPRGTQDNARLEQLLMLLRILRNSCAAGPEAAEVMQQQQLHQFLGDFAATLAQQQSATKPQQQLAQQEPLLLTSVQLLANLSVAQQEKAVVWHALFPHKLQAILSVQQVSVHEAAALAILACLKASREVINDLISSAASSIWLQLLSPLMSTGHYVSSNRTKAATPESAGAPAERSAAQLTTAGNDNMCLLVKAVVLQHGRLQQLMDCLQPDWTHSSSNNGASSSQESAWASLQPNVAHAVLLHVVAVEITALPAAAGDSSRPGQQDQQVGAEQCLPWLQYLVSLLRHLWAVVTSSNGSSGAPTVVSYVLEATLQVLQATVSREDAGRALITLAGSSANTTSSTTAAEGSAGPCDCIQQLHALGLVQLLLDMLKQLGPPPRRQKQSTNPQQQQSGLPGQQTAGPSAAGNPQQLQAQPQPYVGYRADLIAVLSNFLYGRKQIQDEVMSAGGIIVILNNCNLDDTAPMAREWALWCVRNMCRGNEDVQKYISQFTATEAVQSEDLDRMGMQLELDKTTNKLKLVEKPKQ